MPPADREAVVVRVRVSCGRCMGTGDDPHGGQCSAWGCNGRGFRFEKHPLADPVDAAAIRYKKSLVRLQEAGDAPLLEGYADQYAAAQRDHNARQTELLLAVADAVRAVREGGEKDGK